MIAWLQVWGWDLFAIIAYLTLILTIGLWPRKQHSLEDFAIGNREIPWWAVTASILAAEFTAATFLGAPDEGFALRNFTYAQLLIGTLLARMLVAGVFLKPFYEHRVVSIYEFLQIRFGVRTRQAASAVFLFTRALASGTRLYVAAIVAVLGFEMLLGHRPTPGQELALYCVVLVAITALTTLYTALGGIKAVVWTDFLQAGLMLGSVGIALWLLLDSIPGGWSGVRGMLQQPTDLTFWSWGALPAGSGPAGGDPTFWQEIKHVLAQPYTIWSAFLGSTFITLATHGTDQDMVQRMLTAKNHQRSRLALVMSGLVDIPIVLMFLLVGILLWAFYQTHPEIAAPGGGHVFAHYIVHQLPPGLRGILCAGILATAMGSLSTALNALATSFVRDWYRPHWRPDASQQQMIRKARQATVFFGAVLVAVGCATAYIKIRFPEARILPIVLGVFGYTYGSLLGVFLLGMLTRTRGSDRGNLWAMLAGFVVVAILSGLPQDLAWGLFGVRLEAPAWLPQIAFVWRVMVGTVVTVAVGACFAQKQKPSGA